MGIINHLKKHPADKITIHDSSITRYAVFMQPIAPYILCSNQNPAGYAIIAAHRVAQRLVVVQHAVGSETLPVQTG